MSAPPTRPRAATPRGDGTEIRVRIAALAAARAPTALATLGLGSCVAIALHDADAGVGGLAHVLLPTRDTARDGSNAAKFAETAVPSLLAEMRALGAGGRVVARLAGGATMFAALAAPGAQLGDRDVAAARAALALAGVPVVGEDVGGDYGRSVLLDLDRGRMIVRALARADVHL